MIGAIIGDAAGSVFEFSNTKDYSFSLLGPDCSYTDDTVMTVAVAEWLLRDKGHSYQGIEDALVKYGQMFPSPMGGYGVGFGNWLFSPMFLHPYDDRYGQAPYISRTGRHPYGSWGNGSAMRAGAVGWFFDTLEETEEVAGISAAVTHNHPEGIKGAQATAAATWMARNGKSKDDIRSYVESRFGYDLHRTWSELHMTYGWEDSCQGTVPEAIITFLDSTDFENAIRKAVSLGGDSDTLACICGGISEAYYREIPQWILDRVIGMLPDSILNVLDEVCRMTSYGQIRHIAGRRYTPEFIKELSESQVFVFGSNLAGAHGGGAAMLAFDKFGAEWGVGRGMTGKCYAIPTMQGGVETIKPYVDEFIEYAKNHTEKTFLVTKIGCGIAGFTVQEIAPLFREALNVDNILLPEEFCKILE